MNFSEYQTNALRTANTELGPDKRLAMTALGLVGEAGEVGDLLKKVLFHGHHMDPHKIAKELGDVLWYIAVMSHEIGIDLEAVAEMNVAKLRARYPEGFMESRSINRDEG
jgi:NTP pyrophosphatase (non-canonical NTP hydrolase)